MAEPTAQLWRGNFARSVVALASGTAVAQLLLALAVPLLARLYTPADYGSVAVYSSTLTVLLVIASLRYELAIPLPEDHATAGSLLVLTFIFLGVTTALVSLLVWVAGDAFVSAVKVPALLPYRWLIPVALLGAGTYQGVPPADSNALAEALEWVLGSVQLRTELARAGRRRIAEEFNVASIAGELAQRFAGRRVSGRERTPIAVTATVGRRAR
jgi:hypothetical protein